MGRRAVAVGTTALVALLGGAYLGDRWALGEAEDRFADAVRTGVDGLTGEPAVRIAGFPFLTQLAAGSLDDVTVDVDGASLAGVDLEDVDLRARGVTTSEPYRAERAVVQGTLTTDAIEALVAERAGVDVDVAVDGPQVAVTLRVMSADVTAELVPDAQGDAIAVDVVRVTVDGAVVDVEDLPRAVASRLQDLTIPVEGLPDGLALTEVAPQGDVLRLTATGTDVVLPISR